MLLSALISHNPDLSRGEVYAYAVTLGLAVSGLISLAKEMRAHRAETRAASGAAILRLDAPAARHAALVRAAA